jgi:hypothetical protein
MIPAAKFKNKMMIFVNNKNKITGYFLIVLSVIIFTGLVSCGIINFSFGADSTVLSSTSTALTGTTDEEKINSAAEESKQKLSEQPDESAFKEYFSELGLGKLPSGGSLPVDLKKNDNVFISNGIDQLVIYGTLLKDAKLSNAIYDVKAKKNIREKSEFAMVMKKGGFAGSEPVNLLAGLFEYKIWVADKLVGVFPFEVKP